MIYDIEFIQHFTLFKETIWVFYQSLSIHPSRLQLQSHQEFQPPIRWLDQPYSDYFVYASYSQSSVIDRQDGMAWWLHRPFLLLLLHQSDLGGHFQLHISELLCKLKANVLRAMTRLFARDPACSSCRICLTAVRPSITSRQLTSRDAEIGIGIPGISRSIITQSNNWPEAVPSVLETFRTFSRASNPLLATAHQPRHNLRWHGMILLTLCSQSNMFQLSHQDRLINQIILHNQYMWFRPSRRSFACISLFQDRARSSRTITTSTLCSVVDTCLSLGGTGFDKEPESRAFTMFGSYFNSATHWYR